MNTITEVLTGIVNRVTYHNPATGWSVLRVQPFQSPQQQETVTVHQTKVFAGATMVLNCSVFAFNKAEHFNTLVFVSPGHICCFLFVVRP